MRSTFYDILSSMAKDWSKHTLIDLNPMKRAAYLAHRISNIVISLYSMSVLFYAVGALVSLAQSKKDGELSRDLLLEMELPFEMETLRTYLLVMIAQFLHQFTCATTSGALNALPLTLVLHLGGQVDMICEKISQISSEDDERLRLVIEGHQKIIAFTQNIERMFTYIALMQFFLNTLVICFLGLLIMISIGTDGASVTIVKCALYYAVICLEAFILCYSGEYLSTKSKMIGDAAYQSCWYNLRHKKCRILLILMLRSQKELTISIGKFMKLSLECFTSIVKASASYASVLLAMSNV